MKISVVLLAHNEEKNIDYEIESINKNILKKFRKHEFIIVEDGSTDRTKEIILTKKKKIKIKYSTSKKRRGSKDAMLDGLKLAKGDYVFLTDSGRKFNFKEFWKLYKHIRFFDCVSAFRVNRKDQYYRIILTKLFNNFLNISLGSKFKDCDSGFKIYNNKMLKRILKKNIINPNFISAEICIKLQYLGYKFKEVPINYYQRNEGSKATPIYRIPTYIINFLLCFNKLKKELKTIIVDI